MKIKSLCLMFVQLVMFSSLSYSQGKCQDGDFWQTWFEESQFIGFGNPADKKSNWKRSIRKSQSVLFWQQFN